jgi:RimJ/RimL family protein N-acetyltransferase
MIETERLLIRAFTSSDWQDIWEYLSDPLTYVFEPGEPIDEEQARLVAENRSNADDFFAVELKQNYKVIGHLSFESSINSGRIDSINSGLSDKEGKE